MKTHTSEGAAFKWRHDRTYTIHFMRYEDVEHQKLFRPSSTDTDWKQWELHRSPHFRTSQREEWFVVNPRKALPEIVADELSPASYRPRYNRHFGNKL